MAPDTEPVVRVSLTAIYERVVAVEAQVAELATTLPTHVSLTKGKQAEYDARLNAHANRIDDAETRLTKLETLHPLRHRHGHHPPRNPLPTPHLKGSIK